MKIENLLVLPDELLCHIIKYLDNESFLAALWTCKQLRKAAVTAVENFQPEVKFWDFDEEIISIKVNGKINQFKTIFSSKRTSAYLKSMETEIPIAKPLSSSGLETLKKEGMLFYQNPKNAKEFIGISEMGVKLFNQENEKTSTLISYPVKKILITKTFFYWLTYEKKVLFMPLEDLKKQGVLEKVQPLVTRIEDIQQAGNKLSSEIILITELGSILFVNGYQQLRPLALKPFAQSIFSSLWKKNQPFPSNIKTKIEHLVSAGYDLSVIRSLKFGKQEIEEFIESQLKAFFACNPTCLPLFTAIWNDEQGKKRFYEKLKNCLTSQKKNIIQFCFDQKLHEIIFELYTKSEIEKTQPIINNIEKLINEHPEMKMQQSLKYFDMVIELLSSYIDAPLLSSSLKPDLFKNIFDLCLLEETSDLNLELDYGSDNILKVLDYFFEHYSYQHWLPYIQLYIDSETLNPIMLEQFEQLQSEDRKKILKQVAEKLPNSDLYQKLLETTNEPPAKSPKH